MIVRDADVLAAARNRTGVGVAFSVGTVDERVWRETEPSTPPPAQRLEALRRLTEAGIPCSVLMAPILPGISDSPEQIRATVRACRAAGAVSITPITLHLRRGVREQFMPWLAEARPELVEEYEGVYAKAYAPVEVSKRIAGLVREADADAA
jgi:DNA repair photolyase